MAKLIYSVICSLDGYIEDTTGGFDWAAPDAEVHAFVNDRERPVGTYLYGRRMYEMMRVWEDPESLFDDDPVTKDYAEVWRAARKVVYSRTLSAVATSRTTLVPEFDADAVRRWKADAEADLSIGGPGIAASAFAAGLVDECDVYLVPVVIGGGKRALPDGMRAELALAEEHRFAGGTVYLRYRVTG